jgi:hypothetical protein
MFNNMTLVRYNQTNTAEIERINVPLMYASKEKFYMRIAKDPDLLNPVQLTLPRMAFEMNGITYDPLRKISSFTDVFSDGTTASSYKKVKMTPYNFDFNLYAFVRNTEDGMQIVEQVLPYFNPDYTVTIDFMSMDNFKLDVPIVFNSISYDDSHEGDPEATRSIVWTLNFTMKGYLFGPTSDIKMIRKVTANVMDDTFQSNPMKELRLDNGSGLYKINEMVYQGSTIEEATMTGYVRSWSNNTLIVYDTNGILHTNTDITGAVTNAKYNVASFGINTNQLVNITVTPNPLISGPTDDFGFTTTIEEWPNIT